MNKRQYIRFYIDRNDRLEAIWYKKRTWRCKLDCNVFVPHANGFFEQDGVPGYFKKDFDHEFPDGQYAVRAVPICRSCDSYAIKKVRYCYTEDEAKATIDARLKRNKEASPENLTEGHLVQLARAPMKYIEYFLDFIGGMYGEDERDEVSHRFLKVTQKM